MQTAPAVFHEVTARHMTLAAHMQAVERAIQVMHIHMHEVLTLEDLASAAYLSPSRFKHVFRHLIGIPPGEFLSALRLQAARRLLLTTPLSVTEVCFEVGYSSPGSFTSRFTHRVGLSPRLTDPSLVMGLPLAVNVRRTAGQKSPIEEVFSFQSAIMVKYRPAKK